VEACGRACTSSVSSERAHLAAVAELAPAPRTESEAVLSGSGSNVVHQLHEIKRINSDTKQTNTQYCKSKLVF
uniref:Uncharacterized protein n=1 Tax=Anopheles quadriannulatus TaxID=34691 RepID=A0A182XTS3_ANOQN